MSAKTRRHEEIIDNIQDLIKDTYYMINKGEDRAALDLIKEIRKLLTELSKEI